MHQPLQTSHNAHLLGRGAAPIDLSLIAARASAAMRRASAGRVLDERDRHVLGEVGQLLAQAAGVVEFFGSDGQSGSPAASALAAQIDVAIDAAIEAQPPASASNDPRAVATWLRSKADEVMNASAPPAQTALALAGFFDELSAIALRQTGHVGELTSSL